MEVETNIFSIQKARKKVEALSDEEFSSSVIKEVLRNLYQSEKKQKQLLEELAAPKDFENSLRLEVLQIERNVIEKLFTEQHINEAVFFEFQGEIDMQLDAIEYPDLYYGRGYKSGGRMPSKENFYKTVGKITQKMNFAPIFALYLDGQKKSVILNRLSMLQARIVASGEVIVYLGHIKELTNNSQSIQIIDSIISEHEQYRLKNNFQIQSLSREFPRLYTEFETKMVNALAWK